MFVLGVIFWTWHSTHRALADGRTEIVFWNAGMLGNDIYLALHQFEQENPQYKVIASTSVSPDVTGDAQRLLSSVAGGVPPDVVLFDRFAIGEWASRAALTDLDPYLATQGKNDPNAINVADYYKFTLDEARYRKPGTTGHAGLFGIPTGVDIRLLYSNVNQLKQAGLVDKNGNAQPPRDWSELAKDAVILTRRQPDGSIKRLGFAPNFGNSWLYMYAFQAGGNLLSADGKTVTLASPPVVRALRFMTDIYDSLGGAKQVDGFQQSFQQGAEDPFIKGEVSLKIDGDWGLDTIAQWRRDMDFTMTPAPMPDDRQNIPPVTWAGGFSFVIPSSAAQKDGAFKLIQFLSSHREYRFLQDGNRESLESEGKLYLPHPYANQKFFEELVADTITKNRDVPPAFKQAYVNIEKMLPHTLIRPPSPIGQLLWNKHIEAYSAAVYHHHSEIHDKNQEMKQCLLDAQADAQRALDEIVEPLPPHVVGWGVYFVGYGLLILGMFGAMYVVYRRHRKVRSYSARETGAALLFISPWVIGMVGLTAGPILFSIVLSFARYDVLSPARYVGFSNYSHLFHDDLFYKSLWNTVFMMLRIPVGMALSLVIAMLLNRKIRGIGAYRTAFYMPTIVPVVATSMLWIFLLNPSFGPINIFLRWIFASAPMHWVAALVNHLHHWVVSHAHHPSPSNLQFTATWFNSYAGDFQFTPPTWLTDPIWSKPSIILMGLWGAGGGMIIWLAGLQSIPTQLYEAATVDGANPWQQFLNVTVPMLSPYILFNAIMGVIWTMQIFGEAFIMTSGGPDNSTLYYAYYLFKTAFQYFSMGDASALAWVLFVIVLALTLVQLYLSKKWVHYDQT
jgi:ABC-type sugar transport system permease subunit/ABC-type glycerol-3-phosphate transport system substrate-binding protein